MSKKTRKSNKGFRIEQEIEPRIEKVAEELNIPFSWFVNDALKKQLPVYEAMAEQAKEAAA